MSQPTSRLPRGLQHSPQTAYLSPSEVTAGPGNVTEPPEIPVRKVRMILNCIIALRIANDGGTRD